MPGLLNTRAIHYNLHVLESYHLLCFRGVSVSNDSLHLSTAFTNTKTRQTGFSEWYNWALPVRKDYAEVCLVLDGRIWVKRRCSTLMMCEASVCQCAEAVNVVTLLSKYQGTFTAQAGEGCVDSL